MHHNSIHGAFHIGNQPLAGHQRGVHAQFNALGYASFFTPFGNAQQFDAVAQLLGVFDVDRCQLGNAFHVGFVELHGDAESDCVHDGGLVCSVDAFDVEGGVGLGIAQALGLFEHHVKVQPFVAHFAQNEVCCAVDNACQPLDAVGCKPFAQCLDDGNAPGHGSLEGHHHAFLLRSFKNFGAVHGQQRLVGRHHVLAIFNGFEHQVFGNGVAANQLDHHIHIGAGNGGKGVVHHLNTVTHNAAGVVHIAVCHHGNFNAAPRARLDLGLVALQDFEYTAANSANTHQGDFERFHALTSVGSE